MKERYTPNSNEVKCHYFFHYEFVYRVKAKAEYQYFEFGNRQCFVKDILIRDQIFVGANNEAIREKTLKERDPSYSFPTYSNLVEAWVRPLGKIIKIAIKNNFGKENVIKEIFLAFRTKPHTATGLTPP